MGQDIHMDILISQNLFFVNQQVKAKLKLFKIHGELSCQWGVGSNISSRPPPNTPSEYFSL